MGEVGRNFDSILDLLFHPSNRVAGEWIADSSTRTTYSPLLISQNTHDASRLLLLSPSPYAGDWGADRARRGSVDVVDSAGDSGQLQSQPAQTPQSSLASSLASPSLRLVVQIPAARARGRRSGVSVSRSVSVSDAAVSNFPHRLFEGIEEFLGERRRRHELISCFALPCPLHFSSYSSSVSRHHRAAKVGKAPLVSFISPIAIVDIAHVCTSSAGTTSSANIVRMCVLLVRLFVAASKWPRIIMPLSSGLGWDRLLAHS